MSRRPLGDPPTVDELGELVQWLARTRPAALPALFWLMVRSSAAVRMLRELKAPPGVDLVAIADHHAGRALISSSRAGADRLARWTATTTALDDLLPPIADDAIPPLEILSASGDDDQADQ